MGSLHEMLLDSDNTTAELLLRELGLRVRGQGTTGISERPLRARSDINSHGPDAEPSLKRPGPHRY